MLEGTAGVALLLGVGCGDPSRSSPGVAAADEATGGELFVVTARDAFLSLLDDGSGTLTMRDLAGSVVEFSDRPARSAGTLALGDFVRRWGAFGFDDAPPNAALVVEEATADRDVAVLELRNPRLGGGELVYDVAPIGADVTPGLSSLARRADSGVSGALGPVALFVDDATLQSVYSRYQQVWVWIVGMKAGGDVVTVDIGPSEGPSTVVWAGPPPFVGDNAPLTFGLQGLDVVPPIDQLTVDETRLSIRTTPYVSAGEDYSFFLELLIQAEPGVTSFTVSGTVSDPDIRVTLQSDDDTYTLIGDEPTEVAWPSPTS